MRFEVLMTVNMSMLVFWVGLRELEGFQAEPPFLTNWYLPPCPHGVITQKTDNYIIISGTVNGKQLGMWVTSHFQEIDCDSTSN
jgi:hypothetical protein